MPAPSCPFLGPDWKRRDQKSGASQTAGPLVREVRLHRVSASSRTIPTPRSVAPGSSSWLGVATVEARRGGVSLPVMSDSRGLTCDPVASNTAYRRSSCSARSCPLSELAEGYSCRQAMRESSDPLTVRIPSGHVWRGQFSHALLLAALLPGAWFVAEPSLGDSVWLDVSDTAWFCRRPRGPGCATSCRGAPMARSMGARP